MRRQKLRTYDDVFNVKAEDAWDLWAEKCDPAMKRSWYEYQRLIMREKLVGGEVILVASTPADGRPIPFAVEVLQSERLAMKDESSRDGGKIVQGVQFDASQKITAYWLYPNHPYDGTLVSGDARPIPAERVIHFFEEEEAGQVRGLTKFLTVAAGSPAGVHKE